MLIVQIHRRRRRSGWSSFVRTTFSLKFLVRATPWLANPTHGWSAIRIMQPSLWLGLPRLFRENVYRKCLKMCLFFHIQREGDTASCIHRQDSKHSQAAYVALQLAGSARMTNSETSPSDRATPEISFTNEAWKQMIYSIGVPYVMVTSQEHRCDVHYMGYVFMSMSVISHTCR